MEKGISLSQKTFLVRFRLVLYIVLGMVCAANIIGNAIAWALVQYRAIVGPFSNYVLGGRIFRH